MFLFDAVYCFYQHASKGAARSFYCQGFGPYQALQACTRVYTQRIQRIQVFLINLYFRYL